ncbi:MAG: hypothetical protein ACYCUG_06055 [Acidimicrobiales bacterium]
MTATPPGRYGDWCATCADRGDPSPVRYPASVDVVGGRAAYECRRCGACWNCGWAFDADPALTSTPVGVVSCAACGAIEVVSREWAARFDAEGLPAGFLHDLGCPHAHREAS